MEATRSRFDEVIEAARDLLEMSAPGMPTLRDLAEDRLRAALSDLKKLYPEVNP
jgi:hypothetical protein